MHRQFTPLELEALAAALNLDHLADIALGILQEMSHLGRSVVMLSGPMSTGGAGDLESNMKRFENAVAVARHRGLCVFDQTPFQGAMVRITSFTPDVPYNVDILHVFYRRLLQSGHIHEVLFLDDWQSSRGATWEREECESLQIPIDDFPMEWLEPDAEMPKLSLSVEGMRAICGGRLEDESGFDWSTVSEFRLEDGVFQPYGGDEILPGPHIKLARLRGFF